MQSTINVVIPYGSAEGYTVDLTEPNFWNWLESYKVSKDDPEIKEAMSGYSQVAILKNINVDQEQRGQGYGNRLMNEFINEASDDGADVIALIADKNEDQESGFDLEEWYEDFGFITIKQTFAGPLMIL